MIVIETLKEVRFKDIEEVQLWETRRVYAHKEQLLDDLRKRTGRSLLHELDDSELSLLIDHIDESMNLSHLRGRSFLP